MASTIRGNQNPNLDYLDPEDVGYNINVGCDELQYDLELDTKSFNYGGGAELEYRV